MNCLACNQTIASDLELVSCIKCKDPYHYQCLGITTAVFTNENNEIKRGWRCQSCSNITTRRKNDSTPVRNQLHDSLIDLDDTNATNVSIDHTFCDESNQSLHGDTLYSQQPTQSPQNITLEQIGLLLDSKLKNNNATIISDLKKLIHSEINLAINQLKVEFTQKNFVISSQQEILAQKLRDTNEKIDLLQKENHLVTSQLKDLQSRLDRTTKANSNENQRSFVLYGLDEYYGENESDLYVRLSNMFYNILNVDINGFIETVKRVGKRGNRRPLIVEVISKRMKNYVIKNAHCFKNTGYAVSEVLDDDALRNRQQLRINLRNARKSGNHAVIRGDRLFINGKEHCPTPHTKEHPAQAQSSAAVPVTGETNSSITTTQEVNIGRNAADKSHDVSGQDTVSNDLFRA